MKESQPGRPIEKIAGSYAKGKFDWLLGVGRDSAAEYGLRLAIELALAHFNNSNGSCNPGDGLLASSLCTSTKTIQRMRNVLIQTGHLKYELDPAGRRRGRHSNHVLMLAVHSSEPTTGHTYVHKSAGLLDSFDPITGQFEGGFVDSQNPRLQENQSVSLNNQIQEPDSKNQIWKPESQSYAKTQAPYRQTTGNVAAVTRSRAEAVLEKYRRRRGTET